MKRWPLLTLAAALGASRLWFRAPWWEFAGPLLLGVVSAVSLAALPRKQRIGGAFLLSVVAPLSYFATLGIREASFLLMVFPWLPWVLLFIIPLVWIEWAKLARCAQLGTALALAPLLYLGSGLLVFDFWGATVSPNTEVRDRYRRVPALGPAVSLSGYMIVAPQGPCCVLSCDYDGSEWVWRGYRPLTELWWRSPLAVRYYDSDGMRQ